ncbi:helix-turn-helix domain-containing protein [Candidimonas nitroreducens]
MRIAIPQEVSRFDDSHYNYRFHSSFLIANVHSCQQATELFGEDRRTVQRWVRRFERGGLADCGRVYASVSASSPKWVFGFASPGRPARPNQGRGC